MEALKFFILFFEECYFLAGFFYLAKKKKKTTVGFSSFINETPNVPAIKRTNVENLVLFFSLPAVVPACFYRINRVNYDCHYTNCRIRRILFIYERMYMYSSNSIADITTFCLVCTFHVFERTNTTSL